MARLNFWTVSIDCRFICQPLREIHVLRELQGYDWERLLTR